MTRYISIKDFRDAANVPNAYAIYTIEPLKMWNEDINGAGSAIVFATLVGHPTISYTNFAVI